MNLPGENDTKEQRTVAELHFGRAWLGLAGALALHVTDEALTDFLSVYNPERQLQLLNIVCHSCNVLLH